MNFCRKCQSDYEKAGTCNCFAARVAPQRAIVGDVPIRTTPVPYDPTKSWTWIAQPKWTHPVYAQCECGECRAQRGRGDLLASDVPVGWTLRVTS